MNIDQLFNDVPAFANLRDSNRPVWEWLKVQEKNDFRMSLRHSLAHWGSLTKGQIAAVERIVNNKPDATVDFAPLFSTFAKAKESGLKRPIIRAGSLKVYPAPESGKNAGALYVKDVYGDYLGKVTADGDFFRARGVSDADVQHVADLAADPLGTAIKYARDTGHCACCGRELTDPKSVELGIGPDCKKNFGL